MSLAPTTQIIYNIINTSPYLLKEGHCHATGKGKYLYNKRYLRTSWRETTRFPVRFIPHLLLFFWTGMTTITLNPIFLLFVMRINLLNMAAMELPTGSSKLYPHPVSAWIIRLNFLIFFLALYENNQNNCYNRRHDFTDRMAKPYGFAAKNQRKNGNQNWRPYDATA